MAVLGYRRRRADPPCGSRPGRPGPAAGLFALALLGLTGGATATASAQTLPVPPYQTQGAYRVECQQDDELVLVIEPAYRAWIDRGRIRGWQFVTADGIPIQGRIGTNVNCRYDLLPANAYPLTAFVDPDAAPAAPPTEADTGPAAPAATPVTDQRLAATVADDDPPRPADEPTDLSVTVTAIAPTAAPTINLPPITAPTAPAPSAPAPAAPVATRPAQVEPAQAAPPSPRPVIETAPLDALPAAPADAGPYWVQLGAFDTLADGHLAWARLLNTGGGWELASLQPVLQPVASTPDRILHRLRVDVGTADRAQALCAIQRTAGGDCLMVGPGLTSDAPVADIGGAADTVYVPAGAPSAGGIAESQPAATSVDP